MRNLQKRMLCTVAVAVAGLFAATMLSPFGADAAESKVVKARQQLMKSNGGTWKAARNAIKAGKNAEAAKAAEKLAANAGKIPAAFKMKDMSGKQRALPAVWSKKADFDKIAMDLASAAKTFAAAAKSGDKKAIAAAMKGVGATCGKCHKSFRAKKKK